MTIEEFGKTIQAKYPQYTSMSPTEVGKKMLTKYPQYQNVIKNDAPVPGGATDTFLSGHPILKGISDFLGTTGLAKGAAQGIFLKFTPAGQDILKKISTGEITTQQAENIIGKTATTKEIIGSAIGTGASFLAAGSLPGASYESGLLSKVPGLTKGLPIADTLAQATGLSGKALKATTVGARMLEGGALGYGFDAANRLQNNENNVRPGVGTAIGAGLPFVSALVGALAKRVTGVTSGVGKDVIQRALDNPDAVSEAASTYAKTPEAKQALVDRAKAAISDFLHSRNISFGESIGSMKSAQPLMKQTVVDSFNGAVSKFKGKVKDGVLSFGDTTLTSIDKKNLQDAWKLIKGWKDVTPQGFDSLRQAIGNVMQDFSAANNPRANVVLGQVKKDLASYIGSNVSGYTDALSKYGKESQLAQIINKELGTGGSARPSTQLSNVLKLFKKDKAVMKKLVEVMGQKEANNFLNELSGAILSDWVPASQMRRFVEGGIGATTAATGLLTGSGGTIAPALAAGMAASSPRIVGKTATMIGSASRKGITTGLRRGATYLGSKLNP